MRRAITRIQLLVVMAVNVVILACLIDTFFFEAIWQLLAGWVFFLVRVLPAMTVDWPATLTALACLLALAFGLHWFVRWLYGQVQKGRQPEAKLVQHWQPRWTGIILGVVVLMFVAGISTVGIAHQTSWMLNSPKPVLERSGVRPASLRTQGINCLKQIGLAAHSHNDAKKALPAGGIFDAHGNGLHGWQTALLPYLEEDAVYKRIDQALPWNHPKNAAAFGTIVQAYIHPAHEGELKNGGFAVSHFAGNVYVLGGAVPRRIPQDFPDGTSNTLLAGEAWGNYKPWGYPASWRDPARGICTTPDGFGDPVTNNRALFAIADGTVRTITSKASPTLLKALSTPDGGEKIDDPDWD